MPTRITGTRPPEEVEKHKARRHAIMTATPAQIDTYIDANVNTVADVKEHLKLLTKIAVYNLNA